MATTTKAAVYTRISQDHDLDRLGVQRQEEACRKLAADKGLDVGHVFSDNDISAYSGKARPGYTAMMAAVTAGQVGTIVAWHPDRLHRQPVELEQFIETIETAGVDVATVEAGHFDLSTPSGRMVARQLGAVARYESEHKSARIVAKHAEKAKAGDWCGGPRTFGHTMGMEALEPVEAKAVRDAMTRVLAGAGFNTIASDWADQGIVGTRGKPMSQTTVRRILSSARIAGYREINGEWVEGSWPPIVDRADVLRVRALKRDTRPAPPRSYLLTGIAHCGRCGASLKAQRSIRGKRGYVCVSKPGSPGCNGLRIAADELEAFTVEAVLAAVGEIELPPTVTEVPDVTLRLDDLAARTAALADAFATGSLDIDAFQAATKALADQRAQVEALIVDETAAQARSGAFADLDDRWPGLGFDDRRAALAAVVDRVVIGPAVKGRNRFDPDRVTIVWRV